MTTGKSNRPPLDPWGKIKHEYPEEELVEEEDEEEIPSNGGVGLFEALKRFFVLLFWRPVSTVVYLIGLAYGSLCIYLFAHGELIEPYGFAEVINEPNKAVIPHNTLVVSKEGVMLLLIWLIVPPVWFFVEGYVLCKTQQQRELVREAQEISVKVWLALLGVMAILAK